MLLEHGGRLGWCARRRARFLGLVLDLETAAVESVWIFFGGVGTWVGLGCRVSLPKNSRSPYPDPQ